MVIDKLVQDVLVFGETSDTNIKGLTVDDFLAFQESFAPNFQSTFDQLDFNESIMVNKSFALSMSDALVFLDSGSKGVHFFNVDDILILTDDVVEDAPLAVRDSLVFSETLLGMTAKPVSDTLAFIEVIGLVKSLNLTVQDTLTLRSSDNGYLVDVNFIAISVPSCG